MDLIGQIQYLGNRLDRRSQDQPAHKNNGKKCQPDKPHTPEGSRLGQKLDTTA